MISVVLADDEERIFSMIKKLINWEGLGLELVAGAKDGDELMEKILYFRPDIVITDIKMPGRSGLDIISHIQEMGLSTCFVIISAYANFEYARTAMELGVNYFLPKPVSRVELNQTLQKVVKKVDHGAGEGEYSHVIRTAKAYVDLNFNQPLTLNEVAEKVYVAPAYFSTLFKKETGVSFVQYMTSVRLANARRMLDDLSYSVSQVAEAVGYKDVKYFSKLFTEKYGISPVQFRKNR